MDKDNLCWAAREAEQAQELKLNLAKKVSKNDDLELGVDWEYDWDGTHVPLTNKAKGR